MSDGRVLGSVARVLPGPSGAGDRRQAMITVRTSIVIPNLDSPVVDRAVDAAWVQRAAGGPQTEIVVVGRDRPGRLVGDERVRFVATDGPRLPGAARNIGVEAARGELIVFLDADCVPDAGWLAAHVARHEAGETVVGGAVLWDADDYWTLSDNLSMFHASDRDGSAGARRFLPTLNLSVRRAVFEDVGSMDPGLPRGEDVDWTARLAAAGHTPFFEPAARVWHRPTRAGAHSMLARWYESGRWMVGVRRRHPDVLPAPPGIYHPWLLRLLSPLIATWSTLRLYRPGRPGWRHPTTLPAVWLTKVAWCLGAARPAEMPERLG